MSKFAKHRVHFTFIVVFFMLVFGTIAIFYARGFKPNFENRTIDRTGLIVANSTPTGANVYIDGRLTSATNTTITYLEPKNYKIRIEKDGYTAWEKDISVREDLATEINALLFPLAPEIKPLTTTGATNPTLSPSGTKIAYGVSGERGGVFILPMDNNPLPFRQNARQIVKNTSSYDFSKSTFTWDPDSKQLIASLTNAEGETTANILLDSESSDQSPRDVTASLTATTSNWQQIIDDRAQTEAIPVPDAVKVATASAKPNSPSPSPQLLNRATPSPVPITTPNNKAPLLNYSPLGIMFSPNGEKILYKNAEGKYKIFDLKTETEFTLPDLPDLINISWYPDSEHLVIAQNGSISIIENDGTNKITVYSGKFENGFVFAHPAGSRIIILTTLTQPEATPANLYSINLK